VLALVLAVGILGFQSTAPCGLAGTTALPLSSSRSVPELPPSPGNARNSEGSFLALQDGRILFIYSRFVGGDHDDHAKAVLAARFSADEGETWSGDSVIATPGEDQAMNVMSVSLLRLQNGDVGLFYCLRHSWHDLRMVLRRSSDEGRTWSEPVSCMHASEYHVVNNDRVIRLTSGRLLIPAALHRKIHDANLPSSLDWGRSPRSSSRMMTASPGGRPGQPAPCQAPIRAPGCRSQGSSNCLPAFSGVTPAPTSGASTSSFRTTAEKPGPCRRRHASARRFHRFR